MQKLKCIPTPFLVLALLTVALGSASSADWLREAKYGAFMHLLPSDAKTLAMVDDFDVERLAGQLESIGVKYLVLTLGQNSGYFNAPNAVYDRTTGYRAGERCSKRDLPADLWRALHARGIRLMLYLPCQAPNEDRRAQKAFGLPQGKKDQPIDPAFAQRWASVIQVWADRYGDRVSGWWFDGGYDQVEFNEVHRAEVRRGRQARQPARDCDVQPRREPGPPHAGRGLHGGGVERSVRDDPCVIVRGRIAMACADVSRHRLGAA